MNHPRLLLTLVCLALGGAASVAAARALPHRGPAQAGFVQGPVAFEENRGQLRGAGARVRFVARGGGMSLFLTAAEAVVAIRGAVPEPPREPRLGGEPVPEQPAPVPTAVLRLALLGGSRGVQPVGELERPGRTHYLKGNQPASWTRDIRSFGRVRYPDVYPGIDLVFYGAPSHAGRQLEYDWVVRPGADPSEIRLGLSGASGAPRVTPEGDLLIPTPLGLLRQMAPAVWQEGPDGRVPVAARARVQPDPQRPGLAVVSFALGDYDRSRTLIIDPILTVSTYMGGSAEDVGYGIATDATGFLYVTGRTRSTNFPVQGGFQNSLAGDLDVFVAKLNPINGQRVYTTYLGGAQNDSSAFSRQAVAADPDGNAYVTGSTDSGDFPTTPGAFDRVKAFFNDSFVTKLNPSGNGLVYSTFLGGGVWDYGHDIVVDANGIATVAGGTGSDGGTTPDDFPVTNNAFQKVNRGGLQDAFVTRFNAAGSALLYSTLLGDAGTEDAYSVALDGTGGVVIAGTTDSTNFPTTAGAFSRVKGPSRDAFVARINPAASGAGSLVWSTFLGGDGFDEAYGVDVDPNGNVYAAGRTASSNFPLLGAFQTTKRGTWDAFVTKFNPTGSGLVYSTYYGGFVGTAARGLVVDPLGQAILTGDTASDDLPVQNPLTGFTATSWNAFVARFNANGNGLVFASKFGGSGPDNFEGSAGIGVGDVALDVAGGILVTGSTSSDDLPTVNPLQSVRGGGVDAFVARIADNNNLPLGPPTRLTATTQSSSSILLTWQDNSLVETGFELQAQLPGGQFQTAGNVGANVTQFLHTGLPPDTMVSYRVRAVNGLQFSNWSNTAIGNTGTIPPAAPTGLNAIAAGPTQVNLSWTDNALNETVFEIERQVGAGPFVPVGGVGANVTSFADTSAQPGTPYGYRVRAANSGGASAYSNTAFATTPEGPPAQPSLTAVLATGSDRLTVQWQLNGGGSVTSLRLERRIGAGPFVLVAQPAPGTTSHLDLGLSPNTAHVYRLQAEGPGGASPWSSLRSGLTLPAAPENLQATPGSNAVRLEWEHAGGCTGFKLERRVGNGAFVEVATLGPEVRSHLHGGLLPQNQFGFRLRAYNASGDSATAGPVDVTTLVELIGFVLKPAAVKGGKKVKGTLTLGGPAPAGGAVVTITGSPNLGVLPPTVTIPEGRTSTVFAFKTKKHRAVNGYVVVATWALKALPANLTVRR